jgi:hypothetical protein
MVYAMQPVITAPATMMKAIAPVLRDVLWPILVMGCATVPATTTLADLIQGIAAPSAHLVVLIVGSEMVFVIQNVTTQPVPGMTLIVALSVLQIAVMT